MENTFPPPAFPAQEREYVVRWGGAGTEGGEESPGEGPGGPPGREMNPTLRECTLFLSRVPASAGGEKPDRIASPSPPPGTVQLPAASAQVKWPQPRLGQLGSPPFPDPSPGPLSMATPAPPEPLRAHHFSNHPFQIGETWKVSGSGLQRAREPREPPYNTSLEMRPLR